MVKGRIQKRSKRCTTCGQDDYIYNNRFNDGTDLLIERFNSVINGKLDQSGIIDRVFVSVVNNAIDYKPKSDFFGYC